MNVHIQTINILYLVLIKKPNKYENDINFYYNVVNADMLRIELTMPQGESGSVPRKKPKTRLFMKS